VRHGCRDVNNIAGKKSSGFAAFDRIASRLPRLDQSWIDCLAPNSQRGFSCLYDEVIIELRVDFNNSAGFTMGDCDIARPLIRKFLIGELKITGDFAMEDLRVSRQLFRAPICKAR
jgi:hypothetical protein